MPFTATAAEVWGPAASAMGTGGGQLLHTSPSGSQADTRV